jgi:AraC-like DNA-binding protein
VLFGLAHRPRWLELAPAALEVVDSWHHRVRFDQPENEVLFDAAMCERPFARNEPALHDVVQQNLRMEALRLHARDTVTGHVRELLVARAAAGRLHAESIARELGMSTRTLQRRLAQEHRSVSAILDDVRRSLAPRYLESDKESIAEVSARLGFSSVASFYRAFDRWTGLTPAQWRKRGPR